MNRAGLLTRCLYPLTRAAPRRQYGGSNFLTPKQLDEVNKITMDHLPKPSGSWQEGYNAKNKKASLFCFSAFTCFVGTVIYMENQGVFDLLGNPANWSDRQVERQARYYAKGEKWRALAATTDEDDDE